MVHLNSKLLTELKDYGPQSKDISVFIQTSTFPISNNSLMKPYGVGNTRTTLTELISLSSLILSITIGTVETSQGITTLRQMIYLTSSFTGMNRSGIGLMTGLIIVKWLKGVSRRIRKLVSLIILMISLKRRMMKCLEILMRISMGCKSESK
jgi:hypothetical protein